MRIVLISPSCMDGSKGASLLMRNLFDSGSDHRFLSLYTQNESPSAQVVGLDSYRMPARPRHRPRELFDNLHNYMLGQSESVDGILHFSPTEALTSRLDSFAPDIVYSQLGPPWMMKLTAWIAQRHGIPLIVHVMDDYLIDWPVSGVANRRWIPGLRWLNSLADKAFRTVLERSTVNYCISNAMAVEFSRRYGHAFNALPHPIDGNIWLRQRPLELESRTLSIGFVGSIQDKTNASALLRFAELLDTEGQSARLNIVSQSISAETRDSLARQNSVTLRNALPYAQMPEFLAQCDVLLMPINFDPDSAAFCRLSWPTKLSEYLSSGTPVLYFGPQEINFAQILDKHALARLVTRPEANEVAECLSSYRHWASDVALNAQAYAAEQFDAGRLQLQIRNSLARAPVGV